MRHFGLFFFSKGGSLNDDDDQGARIPARRF